MERFLEKSMSQALIIHVNEILNWNKNLLVNLKKNRQKKTA